MVGDNVASRRPKQVSKDQAGDDRVIEGAEDGDELGDEVDGRGHPRGPKISSILDPRGTRGSRTRPLNSMSRFGSSVATSLATVRRPARNSAAMVTT